MAAKKEILSLIGKFADSIGSGAGLNVAAQARRLAADSADEALSFLKRAASSGRFDGDLDEVEKTALRALVKETDKAVRAMDVKTFRAMQKPATDVPLFLDDTNFPRRARELGFRPLTGININKPGLTLAEFTGDTRERFIDEGAQNLIAAINLDPEAAARYAMFYPRTRDQLLATGVPLDRIGGAWATLSAMADPVFNAELLRRVARNPQVATTSQLNQREALRFLAGLVDDPAEVLGRGKRYNFMMNSINPDDPRFLTADTRYAQNLQGFLNTYGRAPFAGLFEPTQRRYQEIYVEPGLEAARRLGMNPGSLQAASWGNWRNVMAGIPEDLPDDLLVDLAGMDYDPAIYKAALQRLEQMSPEEWKKALKG